MVLRPCQFAVQVCMAYNSGCTNIYILCLQTFKTQVAMERLILPYKQLQYSETNKALVCRYRDARLAIYAYNSATTRRNHWTALLGTGCWFRSCRFSIQGDRHRWSVCAQRTTWQALQSLFSMNDQGKRQRSTAYRANQPCTLDPCCAVAAMRDVCR